MKHVIFLTTDENGTLFNAAVANGFYDNESCEHWWDLADLHPAENFRQLEKALDYCDTLYVHSYSEVILNRLRLMLRKGRIDKLTYIEFQGEEISVIFDFQRNGRLPSNVHRHGVFQTADDLAELFW